MDCAANDAVRRGVISRLAVAKYELRARPGNPKDDANERAACMAVYLAESAADAPEPLADLVEHIEARMATLAAPVSMLAQSIRDRMVYRWDN